MATPDFLQDYAKDYAAQSKAAYSAPIDTSKFTGRQFVAGEDPLQTQAINLATAGVGSYQPFLQAAQTGVSGLSSLTGPQAYQPFMSPYQQQVIDTTLAEYDRSRTGDRQSIQDAAVATGNFGGGREGAMLGEYDARTLADRSALQAQMLQSGFQNAQQAASNAFTQGGQLVDQQYGLSNFQRSGLGADVGALGQLGSLRQGLTQAQLQADQQAARTAAYEPYGRLSQYGQGLTGLSGGVSSAAYAEPTPVSPMSQAIGTALGVGGLYGKIFGFPGSN
ncbi:MAG: hypothetical protein CMQ85_03055 [Gammaproteobacteria bacterium]|jgi:hypothetical protein|nr:hypothetical protein [Gammaproteobacteria bacterium]|tara:strand:- start:3337 stop:4170 length:834 start_codon:yes stop_codon:yes gene_type:complete